MYYISRPLNQEGSDEPPSKIRPPSNFPTACLTTCCKHVHLQRIHCDSAYENDFWGPLTIALQTPFYTPSDPPTMSNSLNLSKNTLLLQNLMAAMLRVCLDVLHYVRLAAYVSRNIIWLMGWIYGTWCVKMVITSVFCT